MPKSKVFVSFWYGSVPTEWMNKSGRKYHQRVSLNAQRQQMDRWDWIGLDGPVKTRLQKALLPRAEKTFNFNNRTCMQVAKMFSDFPLNRQIVPIHSFLMAP